MSDMNFAQMAAMFGMFGNPAMGANPVGMLLGGANAALGLAGQAVGGVQGLLGGVQGAIGGAQAGIQGLEGQLGQGQAAPHHHHHHHHHQQDAGQGQGQAGGQPQGPLGSEIQKLEAEIAHLGDDLKNLLGGDPSQGMGGGMGQGFGQGQGNPFGQGQGNPFGQGQGNPFGQGGFGQGGPFGQGPFGQGGMNPNGNPFGQGLGQPGGLPFGSGFGDPTQQSPWSVTNKGQGQDQIDLGKYTLDLNKSNMQWTLTNKETGAKTNISGDPHVAEGGNKWDFKNNLSFQLDDGTKITVHTIPYGNGQTVSSELDITKGSHGMKVTGLGGNIDGGDLKVADGINGYALDAANAGTNEIYEAGGGWQMFDGTNVNQQVAQQDNL